MENNNDNDKDDNAKEWKIEFAPGAFDNFDGTQEELDELVAEIEKSVADGTFLEDSEPVDLDELYEEDPAMAMHVAMALAHATGVMDDEGNILDDDGNVVESLAELAGLDIDSLLRNGKNKLN